VTAADELELAAVVRTKAKTRGFAFAPAARRRPGIRAVLAVLLDNNSVVGGSAAAGCTRVTCFEARLVSAPEIKI